MRRILSILLICCMALPLLAESRQQRAEQPHMLRLGWGDQHFEYIGWHATPKPANILPPTYSADYNENFRYTQHWFAEYQYRVNNWFSCGGMLDGSGVIWDRVTRNGAGTETARINDRSVYNIVLMPSVYFTYLHHEYVSLHSGLGIGLDINGGTELDYWGHSTVCAPAFQLTLIGITANYQRYFAALDLGALIAMNGGQKIYMFGSRIFSASIGVTF